MSVSLAGCQTTQGPNANWWEVPGTQAGTGPSAGNPGFDPTAVPRTGTEIPAWDPSKAPVTTTQNTGQATQWMNQYDVRKGVQAARVGLLVPLTGRASKVGQEILKAAQMALFDFANNRYELLPYDTQSTPEGAVEAARFALADGVSLVIGPLLSDSAKAISPYLQAANVSALAFTNDSTAASDTVFTLGIRPEEEVQRVISFAAAQGSTRFALLAPADEYGIRVRAAFEAAVLNSGGELSKIVQFLGSDDLAGLIREMADYDVRRKELLDQKRTLERAQDALSKQALKRLELLQTLGDTDFDALLVAAGGSSLQTIAAHLPYYDIDPKKVRILGTSLWEAKWVSAEPALLGGWFAAPSPVNRAAFVKQFESVYAHKPHRLATLAYDAVALSAVLAGEDGQADYSRMTLTSPSGFAGRDGIFRLMNTGIAERGLSVLQVERTGLREVSPAPQSFVPMVN